MALPIGENELGAIYKCDSSAFFYMLDCAYYNNIMIKNKGSHHICTFKEFKLLYPNHIYSNYYSTKKRF